MPIFNEKNEVIAVLDIDSNLKDMFTDIDIKYLDSFIKLIWKIKILFLLFYKNYYIDSTLYPFLYKIIVLKNVY